MACLHGTANEPQLLLLQCLQSRESCVCVVALWWATACGGWCGSRWGGEHWPQPCVYGLFLWRAHYSNARYTPQAWWHILITSVPPPEITGYTSRTGTENSKSWPTTTLYSPKILTLSETHTCSHTHCSECTHSHTGTLAGSHSSCSQQRYQITIETPISSSR
jgi:hypothetical protein